MFKKKKEKATGDFVFKPDNFVETSGAQELILLVGRGGSGVNRQYVVAASESGTFTLAAGGAEPGAQKEARRPALPEQTASSLRRAGMSGRGR